MSTINQSSPLPNPLSDTLSPKQVSAWLRGLFTIAWADGHFEPEERQVILSLMDAPLPSEADLQSLQTISGSELAEHLGHDSELAENFLRTAVMIAIADGIYSFCEDELLFQFASSLNLNPEVLRTLRKTVCVLPVTEVNANDQDNQLDVSWSSMHSLIDLKAAHQDVLNPVRDWLDGLRIHDPRVAHFLCRMIPPQCPFERDVALFGRKVVHIPPLCKLNPLYDQLVSLRFRALSYLADDCHEDISEYC